MTEHKPKTADDEAAAQRHLEDAEALRRHQARLDVNLDVSLGGLASIFATITALLDKGITIAEMAEKVAEFVAPSDVPVIQAFIKVLQEAEALLKKA